MKLLLCTMCPWDRKNSCISLFMDFFLPIFRFWAKYYQFQEADNRLLFIVNLSMPSGKIVNAQIHNDNINEEVCSNACADQLYSTDFSCYPPANVSSLYSNPKASHFCCRQPLFHPPSSRSSVASIGKPIPFLPVSSSCFLHFINKSTSAECIALISSSSHTTDHK